MRCNKCGKELVEGSEFCSYCGSKINNEDTLSDKKYIDKNKILKPKEKICGLTLVIIIIIIIVCSIYIVITKDNKNINNNSSEDEYIQPNNITKKDIDNTFTKYLSNYEWVKENIYIKKDYFGEDVPVYAKQNVSIAKANDYVRIAIIEYEQTFTKNCKVLVYKDGNIQIKDLQNSRNTYILDTEKNTLYQYFQDMSSIGYNIYFVTENGVEKICYISAHYTGVTDEGDMILEDFKKDGASITESEFNNIKQQYINENLSEDEIFNNIDYLIGNEDILNFNVSEEMLLKAVSDNLEVYKASKRVGEVIEEQSTVTYIDSIDNYYIFRMDLKYYPATSLYYETDTSTVKEMQIFVLYDNARREFKIYNNYTDIQNDLYSLR